MPGDKLSDQELEQALRNYEFFNELPKGTATYDQLLKATASRNLEEWAKWIPSDPELKEKWDEFQKKPFE